MWLQSKTATYTTKFTAKQHLKKNMENYLVHSTFQFKYENKGTKNVFVINRYTFPSSQQVF